MKITKNQLKRIIREELRIIKIPLLEGNTLSLNDPSDVLKAFGGKLKVRGYNVSNASSLGSGHNGEAFKIGNKVLKVTIDDHEARTANHLKGKTLKHIIHIYDVFKFPTNSNWYGIIEDIAAPLSDQEKMFFDMHTRFILSNINMSVMQQLESSPWYMPWHDMKQRVLNNTKEFPEDYANAQEAFQYLEKIRFHELLAELIANKVEYFDVHSGNFMKRGNNLVLVDLGGHSQSPGMEPNSI